MKDEEEEHQVVFSPSYKKQLWEWLNLEYRAELREILLKPGAASAYAGAERLQFLIRSKLASDGIKDAEDLYQLLIGTTSEEFWCEVLNEVSDGLEGGKQKNEDHI